MQTVIDILTPVLMVFATALAPLAAAAFWKMLSKYGIDIEASNREALQSALKNAAILAVSKFVPATYPAYGQNTLSAGMIDKSVALDYIKKSVPEAMAKFDVTDKRLLELLEPHIAKALTDKFTITTP